MFNRKPQSKKDPKKIVAMLRQAIAGEDLVKEPIKGIDLSELSTDQLKAIWNIKHSGLSQDEQLKEVKKIVNNGVEPISGFKFKWFEKEKSIDHIERIPSWFREDD